ncbi:MAG TPA: pyridoxal-dependent decarboxylase [Candidatus Aquilonibacter sp.]
MLDQFVDNETLRRSADLLQRIEDAQANPACDESLPATLPDIGIGNDQTLAVLAPLILGAARQLGDPGFFAHMDPPVPSIAAALSFWNASLNQNVLHPDTAPIAREIEERLIRWLAPLFGMVAGHMVPGSTIANLEALWMARELRGVREVVASRASHLSLQKAAGILGLSFRAVETDHRQRLRPEFLGDLSQSALVLTAGTTAAGAIDPLGVGQTAAWRHVDAAWGGPLCFSSLHSHLLSGLENADSVAVSAHKLLFQPKDSALLLVADRSALDAVTFGSAYLRAPNIGLMGSSGARAVPLLATLLAFGKQGMASIIDHCMSLAQELALRIERSGDFELFDAPQSGCVLWRSRRVATDRLARAIRNACVSTAEIDGDLWLRSVAANPFASPSHVYDSVQEAVSSLTTPSAADR